MRSLRPRLSYANVMATIAMFIALGGGAYAAMQLPKNSVGSKQLKGGAVTPAKLSGASKAIMTGPRGADGPQGLQGISGPRGERGERGEPGAAATKLFAQVRSDGTVNASGSPVTVYHPAAGSYRVNFGRDISHCVAVANQGGVPLFESPGSATGAAQGNGVRLDIYSPISGGEFAPGFPFETTVAVTTFSGNTATNSAFYLAVLC